jgi:hypothetical protein
VYVLCFRCAGWAAWPGAKRHPVRTVGGSWVVSRVASCAQTPHWCGRAGLGQAAKQQGAARYNRPVAGHSLGAGPYWPQPPFQTPTFYPKSWI